ncbi:hypothetical protein E4U61_008033 [Claviceps capensis]|nr:hypothetical protein E4U61_008033 [Claviceps capensis]
MRSFTKYRRRAPAHQARIEMPSRRTDIHVNLTTFRKYGTAEWDLVDERPPVDPNGATEEELQDRVLCYLNEYLTCDVTGQYLHRRFCEDFEGWTTSTWSRVSKPLRLKLRNELESLGLIFNADLANVSEKLAEHLARGQRSVEASSAGPAPRSPSADSSATAHSEEELPVDSSDSPSADRQETEENLPEDSASARPELVTSFEEKPSADPVDKPAVDRAVESVATLHIAPTISKDPAADETRAGLLRRRSMEDFKNERVSDAVVDKDPDGGKAPTDLPDPPDLQRRRSENPEEERPAEPLYMEINHADYFSAASTFSENYTADEAPGDTLDLEDRMPEDHERNRTPLREF